ncbi:MAG: tRNA (N6-threonylcarbamoyladenosine(37)-N6)-methyltransferase TrmO [Ammonifex sp.]|nr:MAG: tRNA (N6-threonylcarbamoyladenosine(37)-N6)-methyltransferase TrmO [Ammonifex sp.]
MKAINYKRIGTIRTLFKEPRGTPIQPAAAKGVRGTVTVEGEYAEGLKDLEGFSHIILIYHFHLSEGYSLTVTPFMDDRPRGVFATRAPRRPNPIGISVVKLLGVEGSELEVENVDVVDGTPLLDIKPYVPQFDGRAGEEIGWLSGKAEEASQVKADDRFK